MNTITSHTFYQGQLDNFCAAYAVLNALKLIRNIPPLQARVLFNEVLFHEAKNPETWLDVINHSTDYHAMVSRMLQMWTTEYSYNTFCPFSDVPLNAEIPLEDVWNTLQKNVIHGKSTVVMRFCRFLPQRSSPVVDHWSTIGHMDDNTIYLFDCSLEPSGWYILDRNKLFIAPVGSLLPYNAAIEKAKERTPPKDLEWEYAMIPAEHLHVVQAKKSLFDILK